MHSLEIMQNPYFHLFSVAWKHAIGRRTAFVVAYAMFIVANTISSLEPLVLAWALNVLQAGGENVWWNVLLLLVLYRLMPFFFWCLHGPARVIERETAFSIQRHYLDTMFRRITEMPLKWHRDHHSGETYDRLYKGWRSIDHFSNETFMIIEMVMKTIIAVVAILIYMPLIGSVLLIISGVIFYALKYFDVLLVKNRKTINRNDHKVTSYLYDYITNITTVVSLRLEQLARKTVLKQVNHVLPVHKHTFRVNEWKWFWVSMLVSGTTFAIVAAYLIPKLMVREVLMIGTVVALFQYTERFTGAFFSLAWQYEDMVWKSTDLKSAEHILDDHKKLTQSSEKTKAIKLSWKQIVLQNLDFQYEDAEHNVHHIRNVSLQLQRKKKIALVGESGSGKSTLMLLLRGLEEVDQGTMSVDGVACNSLRQLSAITTLIPQEPEIFEHSIEHNITVGLRHRKKDIELACAVARFSPVLKRLPEGLQSDIKEKGVNLSGGEKQRLALARGIFAARRSSVLLLDEPTSSVDSSNELTIFRNVFKHFSNHCIVASVHRLHLLPLFDEIHVFKRGRIVEQGTFEELRKQKGLLADMWKKYQAQEENAHT